MNLYYIFFKKIGTNATCTLKKIKIIIPSTRHITIYAQSACHTVYHVSKYAVIWGRSVFQKKNVLYGCKSNRKFYKGENRK